MPSKRNKPVSAEDVTPQELTAEAYEAAQELPAGEAEVIALPAEEHSESKHPEQCFYAGDPKDDNCAGCDGWDPVGQLAPDGKCCVYEKGPAPENWADYYAEQAAAVGTSPEAEDLVPSLAENVLAAVGTGEATTSLIHAEIGITEQIKTANGNDAWIKCTFSESRNVPAGADLENERAALWADVQQEVTTQLELLARQY